MQLLNYWPDFLAGLLELQALAGAEQPELIAALQAVRDTPNDFFVTTLTAAGAARWERLLGLPVQEGGALSDRRFRILTKATEQRPFTLPRLRELLGTLCGADGVTVAVAGSAFTLTVRVALTAKQNYDDVGALLGRVVPANLVIDLSLLYNQYLNLEGTTHGKLAAYTHEQLRDEVIS